MERARQEPSPTSWILSDTPECQYVAYVLLIQPCLHLLLGLPLL